MPWILGTRCPKEQEHAQDGLAGRGRSAEGSVGPVNELVIWLQPAQQVAALAGRPACAANRRTAAADGLLLALMSAALILLPAAVALAGA